MQSTNVIFFIRYVTTRLALKVHVVLLNICSRISGKMSKISDTTEKDQVGSQVLCLYWTNSIRSTFLINSFIYKELDHRQLEVINVWTDKIGAHN